MTLALSTIYIGYIGYIGHICHSRKTINTNNGGRMGIKKSTILLSALCLCAAVCCNQQKGAAPIEQERGVFTIKMYFDDDTAEEYYRGWDSNDGVSVRGVKN